MSTDRLYPPVDLLALGDHYIKHVQAMTEEGLHSKGDIAAQLAVRDQQVAALTARAEAAEAERDAERQCSTCGGAPHPSGKVCICSGRNTRDAEVDGLRLALFTATATSAEGEAPRRITETPCGHVIAYRDRAHASCWLPKGHVGEHQDWRAIEADRDRLAALLREAQSYLLADEERRKLTGDALHAEGELARAHAQLERLDTAEGVIAILRRVGSLTPALERCVYQHYVNHALDEAQRTVRPQVEAERAAEGAAPAPGPAAQANRGEVTWKLLIDKLLTHGGCIVASADCSEMEIADARARGDFYADASGYGYVRRLPEWLARHSRFARIVSPECCER